MPVSISIEPFTPTIDMYGSPDAFSAYSVSGHITVKVTAGSSILGLSFSRSPQNILLSSLELTFEGQTEFALDAVGYASHRIISITKEMVSPSEPIHMSAHSEHAEWRFIFNLAVPGWLPGTSTLGGDDDDQHAACIHYALHACARFISTDADVDQGPSGVVHNSSAPSIWNSLCSVIHLGLSRPKTVHAAKVPIVLTRYFSPPSPTCEEEQTSPPVFPQSLFAVEPILNSAPEEKLSLNIPVKILRSMQLHAVVPSRTSIDDDSVPLSLQLRCQNGDEETGNGLKVLSFEAYAVQLETYHTSPPLCYTARFPLPPAAEQQTSPRPFKPSHPLGALYEIGLISEASPDVHVMRECSLVVKGTSTVFKPRWVNSTDKGVSLQDNWLSMDAEVPVSQTKHKRVAGTSPLIDVEHEMRVRLTVGYGQPGEDGVIPSEELSFAVPLKFVNVMPRAVSGVYPLSGHMYARSTSSVPLPIPPMTPTTPALSHAHSLWSLRSAAQNAAVNASSPSLLPPALPAYSQLYYENGDRKEEYHGTLPVYHEKEDTPSCGRANSDPCASTSSLASTSSMSSSCSGLQSPPDMPRMPPGLAGCRPEAKHETKTGESFLLLDEEGELEGWRGTARDLTPEHGVDVDPGDVQYGIAF